MWPVKEPSHPYHEVTFGEKPYAGRDPTGLSPSSRRGGGKKGTGRRNVVSKMKN